MKIDDICIVVRGSSPRPQGDPKYYGGNIPRLMIADLTRDGKHVTPKIDFLTIDGAKKSRPMKKGDVIIAVSGDPGRPCILSVDACIHDGFVGLRELDKTKINPEFLYYLLKRFKLQNQKGAVGAVFKNLTTDQIKEIQIPSISLQNQIRIANLLSKAEGLINKRKETLKLLDELINSKFLEIYNLKSSLKVFTLNEIKSGGNESFSNGPFGSDLLTSELTDKGVPVIYIRDIRNGNFEWLSNVYVTQAKANSLTNCQVISGDLLIAKVGDPPGISAIYPKNMPTAVITQDVVRLRLNKRIVKPVYLKYYLNSTHGQVLVKKITIQGTRSRFPLGEFKKLKVSLPSLLIQQKFSEFVEKVDSLKNKQQASLIELENLYQSLMQRAFKGELSFKEDVEWLNTTGDDEDSKEEEIRFRINEIDSTTIHDKIKPDSNFLIEQLKSLEISIKNAEFASTLSKEAIERTKVIRKITEDTEKISKLINPSVLNAINSLTAFQNSPALIASIEARKNYEKIIQVASKYSQAGNAIFENTFEKEMSDIIKNNFSGADFNFQMIVELLENEKAIVPVYLTSQELKDNYSKKDKSSKELLNERDIKSLIFDSIEGKNSYLELEQFYHNERENPGSLKLLSKYEELYKDFSTDERSGIYFRIMK